MLTMRRTLFHPNIFLKKAVRIKVSKSVQENGAFVVLISRTYQDGLNAGYIIIADTKFSNYSGFGAALNIAKGSQQVRAYSRCVVPFKLKVWKKSSFIIIAFEERKNTMP